MIDAYLRRIAYTGPREPTPATLRALHEQHMLSVPFENLDIHRKRPIVVDERRFLDKIVGERRGGFCYELNGAFAALLRELGFDVTMLSGRVANGEGGFGPEFDHMALLVRFDDGSRWLADVGFGDSFIAPLSLDTEEPQHDRAGTFRVIRAGHDLAMQSLHDGEWQTEYLFNLDAHALDEYGPMCDWQQTSPDSPFTKKRVCSRATPTGRITLRDGRVIVTENGVKSERAIDDEEWERILATM